MHPVWVCTQREKGISLSELNIGGFVDGPSIGSIILDGVQGALEVGGLIPGLGEAADLTNALIYTFRKDNKNAAVSLGSAIPFVGWGAVSAKWGSKISSWVSSKFAAKGVTQAENKVFLFIKEGVVLPKGAKIPGEFIENAHRSSNYGIIQNGKFVEKLRIDPATPSGFKGPNQSHYHLNNGGHIFDASKWPWW